MLLSFPKNPQKMSNYYVVFSSHISFQPDSAHEIHDVMCANAAANLGYPAVLVYPEKARNIVNFLAAFSKFKPQDPTGEFINFYNVQNKVKVTPIPIANFLEKLKIRGINKSSFIYKYYLPSQLLPLTKQIHTRDWNCVKTAIKNRIPTIYERHYFQEQPLEKEIVESPFLKVTITSSDLISESLIKAGMPAEKTVFLHNGFGQPFLVRQPQEAQAWREELLENGRQHLAVYVGALYRFKGVDLLLDVAKQLPDIQFILAGGTEEQVKAYQQLAREKAVENVNFLGWIRQRSRLVSLLQAADILVHPHCSGKSASFTNPVKFFQYMAAGVPIVSTEIPPLIPFKSSSIIAGWCPPDNPTDLAQCLQHTLNKYPRKPEGYTENIEFSRQFSWEERALKIAKYCQR